MITWSDLMIEIITSYRTELIEEIGLNKWARQRKIPLGYSLLHSVGLFLKKFIGSGKYRLCAFFCDVARDCCHSDQSRSILRPHKPSVVLGSPGFPSFSVVLQRRWPLSSVATYSISPFFAAGVLRLLWNNARKKLLWKWNRTAQNVLKHRKRNSRMGQDAACKSMNQSP